MLQQPCPAKETNNDERTAMTWSAQDLLIVAWALLTSLAVIALVARLKKIQTRGGVLSRMEAKLDLLLKQAGINFDPFKDVPSNIVEAVRAGDKIEAIKLYRQANRIGLREAKEAIEEMQRRAGA
jgi:ribosomal protein L7/L12